MAPFSSISITTFTFFFIALSLYPSTSASCNTATCYPNEPVIRFPFRVPTRQPNPSCGYRGFDVSCNSSTTTNMTLLNIPGSGRFTVRAIDYGQQELWLNDPDSCLPRRLLSLNLSASGSPFKALFSEKFSFFNCSASNFSTDPIECLSGSSYAVFATSSNEVISEISGSCRLVGSVMVPVQRRFDEKVSSSDLSDDLRLTWEAPQCGPCESRGGRCRLKTGSGSEIVCRNITRQGKGLPRAARYAITVGVGIPGILLIVGLLSCICGKVKSYTTNGRDQITQFSANSTVILGLDESTIDSYPKTVLGESRRLPKVDDVTCSICLGDYRPKDTLKTIPKCNHFFHAECVDQWLRLSETCPICRNSPPRLSKVINDNVISSVV